MPIVLRCQLRNRIHCRRPRPRLHERIDICQFLVRQHLLGIRRHLARWIWTYWVKRAKGSGRARGAVPPDRPAPDSSGTGSSRSSRTARRPRRRVPLEQPWSGRPGPSGPGSPAGPEGAAVRALIAGTRRYRPAPCPKPPAHSAAASCPWASVCTQQRREAAGPCRRFETCRRSLPVRTVAVFAPRFRVQRLAGSRIRARSGLRHVGRVVHRRVRKDPPYGVHTQRGHAANHGRAHHEPEHEPRTDPPPLVFCLRRATARPRRSGERIPAAKAGNREV